MPALQAFFEAHQGRNFNIIAIEAGDPVPEVADFVRRYGLTFPVWTDPTLLATAAFRNPGLPSSYVIDAGGNVRLAWAGAISLEKLEEYVTPLLEE
jgi:peroxiredoxin